MADMNFPVFNYTEIEKDWLEIKLCKRSAFKDNEPNCAARDVNPIQIVISEIICITGRKSIFLSKKKINNINNKNS